MTLILGADCQKCSSSAGSNERPRIDSDDERARQLRETNMPLPRMEMHEDGIRQEHGYVEMSMKFKEIIMKEISFWIH